MQIPSSFSEESCLRLLVSLFGNDWERISASYRPYLAFLASIRRQQQQQQRRATGNDGSRGEGYSLSLLEEELQCRPELLQMRWKFVTWKDAQSGASTTHPPGFNILKHSIKDECVALAQQAAASLPTIPNDNDDDDDGGMPSPFKSGHDWEKEGPVLDMLCPPESLQFRAFTSSLGGGGSSSTSPPKAKSGGTSTAAFKRAPPPKQQASPPQPVDKKQMAAQLHEEIKRGDFEILKLAMFGARPCLRPSQDVRFQDTEDALPEDDPEVASQLQQLTSSFMSQVAKAKLASPSSSSKKPPSSSTSSSSSSLPHSNAFGIDLERDLAEIDFDRLMEAVQKEKEAEAASSSSTSSEQPEGGASEQQALMALVSSLAQSAMAAQSGSKVGVAPPSTSTSSSSSSSTQAQAKSSTAAAVPSKPRPEAKVGPATGRPGRWNVVEYDDSDEEKEKEKEKEDVSTERAGTYNNKGRPPPGGGGGGRGRGYGTKV